MKLLAVRMARSIWLVPTYFLNPRGIFARPLFEAMKNRYSFLKAPLDDAVLQPSEGFKFESGAFNGKDGAVIITSMTIFPDGFVVETRSSTDDGDAFLEDALNWSSKEFGFVSPTELPFKKIYASELNVSFQKAPAILNPKLVAFFKDVSSAISDESKGDAEFLGFQLSTDYALSDKPAQFKFERELNVPYEENRYYSFAPTTTDAHVKLLEKFEQLTT